MADESPANASASWLDDLGSLADIAGNTYKTVQGTKLAETQAKLTNAQAKLTTTTAVPWYKAAWVVPAAIGGGVLVLFALFSGSRR